jgi:hypothetical protein
MFSPFGLLIMLEISARAATSGSDGNGNQSAF